MFRILQGGYFCPEEEAKFGDVPRETAELASKPKSSESKAQAMCGVSLRPGRPGIKVPIVLAARALRAVSLFFLQGEHFICFIIFCPQNIKYPLLHFTQRTGEPM